MVFVLMPREGRTPSEAPRFRILADLDHHRLLDEYLATDEEGRLVRLFALRASVREDLELRDLFFSLVRRAAVLAHPGIPPIVALVDSPTAAYLAVEHSPGVSLRELLAACEGRLSAGAAAFLAWRVAGLLALAHAAPGGPILHLGPGLDRVWLGGPEGVQLLGFGVSEALFRFEQAPGCRGPAALAPAPDRSMPPEVIRGKASTTRSDVYRTGALLYRLLTGAPPGRGSNPLAIMQCLLEGQWDRDALDRAGVPPLLASVVHLCLATDPDERFPGAADLRDALALSGTLPPDGLPPDLAQLAARLTK